MEITLAGQTWAFLWSIGLGAALGACYDLFRILRVAVRHPPAAVVVEDLLFSAVCGVATLLFLIGTGSGEIRIFVLVGELVGFVLYYCTLGVLVIGAAKGIVASIKWVLRMAWRIFIAPVLRILEAAQQFLSRMLQKSAKCLKIKLQNSGTHLKRHSGLLYNLRKQLRGGRQKKINEGQEQHNR